VSALDSVLDDFNAREARLKEQLEKEVAENEAMSKRLFALIDRVKELEDPRNEYGIALAIEREKVRLLVGAIEQAAGLYEKVRASGSEYHAPWDEFDAWLKLPLVVAARREAKG
jgi:hypothetical protein